MPDDAHQPGWSRRRFLRAAAVLGLAGAGAGVLAFADAIIQSGSRISSPGPGPGSPLTAAPGGPAAALAGSLSSPDAPASPGNAAGERVTSADSGRRAFRSRPDLAAPVVTVIETVAGRTAAGYLLLTPANGSAGVGPLMVDGSGEPVWIRPAAAAATADFRVVDYLGESVLGWWEGANNAGVGSGEYVLMDATYREIKRIRGAKGAAIDLHEFRPTPAGTVLVFVYTLTPYTDHVIASTPIQVMDCVVQELDLRTGDVVFEWHSLDHVGLRESYVPVPTDPNSAYDYVHANSIDVDTDGNLLVSARNTSTVYKVNRTTGAVMWRLGGRMNEFAIDPDAAFGWQHDVRRRADGTISMFDNANGALPPAGSTATPSRALVLEVDEPGRTVSLRQQFVHDPPLVATSQGDAQLLPNGNVLVGWGSTPWATEYASDGTVVADVSFAAAVQSYRDLRFPWHGRPGDAPAIAAERTGASSVRVFASWNGHTAVASWELLGGDAVDGRLTSLRAIPRSGFETVIEATARTVVAVRALDAGGQTLGESPAIVPTPLPV